MIDNLFYQIVQAKDSSDIASTKVVSNLISMLKDNHILEDNQEDTHLFLGMVSGWQVRHYKDYNKFSIQFDNTPPLLFTILRKSGKLYVADLEIVKESYK